MLNKKQLDAWPNCSVNGCVNKSCLRLNSDKCYLHTKRGGIVIRPRYYKLEGKMLVACSDVLEWAAWYESADPSIARFLYRGVYLSTVFLGLDYNLLGVGEPMLFELMITGFGGSSTVVRYPTWDLAMRGHTRAIHHLLIYINRFRKRRKPKAKR